ncbi:MAG: redoxin domain-containing protein [Candidatus Eremiobacteraeota bacterium]|nr:redoxin domain-containing protein [Candidatus Eremiobacteraeota bacterium]
MSQTKVFAPLAVLAAASALLAPSGALAASPAVGTTAPDFTLKTVDGTPVTLSALRGKVVVVNFFATWCPPCRAETPDLISQANSFESRGVVFVGIDGKESPELVQEFASAKGIRYPIVLDRDGKIADLYDVRAIPTTFVVGPTGKIQWRQVDELSGTVLASAVNDVLAGRVPNESSLQRSFVAVAVQGTQTVNRDVAQAQGATQAHDKSAALSEVGQAIATGTAANKKLDDLQNADDQSSINYWQAKEARNALGLALADAYELRAKLQPSAKTTANDLEQAMLLRGQNAEDNERFATAESYYKQASVYEPKDTNAYDGIYLAAFEQKDYATARDAAQTETEIAPKDPESWLTLASALNLLKQYDAALAAERSALILATTAYGNHPLKKRADYEVGRVFLKTGRTQIMAGDNEGAKLSLATSSIMAPDTIVAQQADEQLAALSPQPVYVAVSGADLVKTTGAEPAKLWVTVHNAAPQARTVHLAAMNVPKKWVLSFCYDKVCDPYKSDVSVAANATRRVELQVVPLGPVDGPWNMKLEPGGVDQMDVTVNGKTAKASITVLAS